jgi:hypothetical protein
VNTVLGVSGGIHETLDPADGFLLVLFLGFSLGDLPKFRSITYERLYKMDVSVKRPAEV